VPDDTDQSATVDSHLSISDDTAPVLGLLLRLAAQQWGEDVDDDLRAAGFDDIRAPHANVFPFVPPEGATVSEIAQRATVRKQTMAQAVEQLERAGYVARRPDPHDRRARRVVLTEQGESVRATAVAAAGRVEGRWADLMGEDDLETLRGLLRRLLGRLAADPS
jgi:DNA-binding MarR family transcriptional regulator